LHLRLVISWQRGLLMALPLLAGCTTYRAVPHHDLVPREYVKVVADSGFVMHAQLYNHTTEMPQTCRVLSAEGTLHRVSADTVWLVPISVVRPASGESDACLNLSRAFTIRDASTNQLFNARRLDRARSTNALIWGTVVGAAIYWWVTVSYADVEGIP
jgi:hypothetical protein